MADLQGTTSVNIPQLIAVALVGFFAIRWFMSKPPAPGSGASTSSAAAARRGQQVDITKVEQVAAMFPQLDRRTIAWDLQRNGQVVAATTERVLSGRALDTPPPSYQPQLPSANEQAPAVGVSSATSGVGKKTGKDGGVDLITRYGLQGKVSGKGKEAMPSEAEMKRTAAAGWSSDKASRAEALRKRREEMVLEARRRMEAKDVSGGDA